MPSLFDEVVAGDISAKNRVWMAPLTRARATADHVPTALHVEYYRQRASAGLIISEATGISREGLGWPYAPGIWSEEQVEAWKPVTEAVHKAGGKIVLQLWHMGRMAHSTVIKTQPIAPSAVPAPSPYVHTYEGKLPPDVPREATKEDIKRIIADYAQAARNAITAGFDGVQLHGANGYLIDSFMKRSVNKRTDEYGGSPENRGRFAREAVDAVAGAIGASRTSIRLSPNGDTQGSYDEDPASAFVPFAAYLQKVGIAFLELREIGPNDTFMNPTDQPKLHSEIRKVFHGVLALNQEYNQATATEALKSGVADAITFGRYFISNPDLVQRFRDGLKLTPNDFSIWYTQGPKGYVDWPAATKTALVVGGTRGIGAAI